MTERKTERVMYLPAGTSDSTIQRAINELNAERKGNPHAGKFGRFRTKPITVMNRGGFFSKQSAGSTQYVRLTVDIAGTPAHDALYAKLGAVQLGD